MVGILLIDRLRKFFIWFDVMIMVMFVVNFVIIGCGIYLMIWLRWKRFVRMRMSLVSSVVIRSLL